MTQRQQDFSRELQPEIVHTFTVTDDAGPGGGLQSLDQPEVSSSFQTSQLTEQATAVLVSGLKESPEIRLIPSAAALLTSAVRNRPHTSRPIRTKIGKKCIWNKEALFCDFRRCIQVRL